jgi:threonine/homoserine/homoserine lactone efflux protein
MFEIAWVLFLGTSLVVIVAPGQDMVLVMSRGIGQGARAGLATGAGVSLGLLGHSALAALGLGALLETSELAYLILRYVGAAYLLYLGIRLLLSGASSLDTKKRKQAGLRRLFLEGMFSNLSNPKVALFYFAFLPQFVPASVEQPAALLFTLGVVFALLTFLVKVPIGYFAGTLSAWFRSHPKALAWIYRSSGMVLVGLGLRLAFEERD